MDTAHIKNSRLTSSPKKKKSEKKTTKTNVRIVIVTYKLMTTHILKDNNASHINSLLGRVSNSLLEYIYFL